MPHTNTSEAGLESLIVAALTGLPVQATTGIDAAKDAPAAYGGVGYVLGDPSDYNRE